MLSKARKKVISENVKNTAQEAIQRKMFCAIDIYIFEISEQL